MAKSKKPGRTVPAGEFQRLIQLPCWKDIREHLERDRRLTPREAQVAILVNHGLTNIEIGMRLGIVPDTVNKHVDHIMAKLDVRNRTQIGVYSLGYMAEGPVLALEPEQRTPTEIANELIGA
jgi:DNA-binding NarL/FixJ family response regulator